LFTGNVVCQCRLFKSNPRDPTIQMSDSYRYPAQGARNVSHVNYRELERSNRELCECSGSPSLRWTSYHAAGTIYFHLPLRQHLGQVCGRLRHRLIALVNCRLVAEVEQRKLIVCSILHNARALGALLIGGPDIDCKKLRVRCLSLLFFVRFVA